MTTDTPTPDATAAAISTATETAAALIVRVAAVRAGSADDAAQDVVRDAVAAAEVLVDAVPALAERHEAWTVRFEQTVGQPGARRALAATQHLTLLARVARRPVIIEEPGARFAGDWDEPVITRP